MTAVLAALLNRPLLDIAGIVGLLVMVIIAAGFAIYLILRGLSYLHIKKIDATGIVCETMTTPRTVSKTKRK